MRPSTYTRALSLALLAGLLLAPLTASAQGAPPADAGVAKADATAAPAPTPSAPACKDKLIALSDANGIGLKSLLAKLDPADAAKAMSVARCEVPDLGMGLVMRFAIAGHDKPKGPSRSLYISPSQQIVVKPVDGGVPSSEVLLKVSLGAPWWTTNRSLDWDENLAVLNAETHYLNALLASIDDNKELERRSPGRELSIAMLAVAVYIDLAKANYPAVWPRLSADPAQVDALRLLWSRAETALLALQARQATTLLPLADVFKREAPMRALFKAAGVPAPAFDASLKKAAALPPAVAQTPPPAVAKTVKADAGVAPAADAGAAKEADAGVAAAPAPADTPKEPAAKDPPKDEPEEESAGHTEVEEVPNYAGWVALGVAIFGPWLWIAFLWTLSRRKNQLAYIRFANRSLAVATLFVVFECLGAAAVLRPSNLELLANRWALLLLWPIYFFAVLIFMLGKLDRDQKLAARQLMRKWGKWGGALVIVLAVVNSIVLAFFSTIATFFLFPSLGLVGLLGVIFLVKLWRTGNVESVPEGQTGEGDGDGGDGDAQEPVQAKPEPPAPKPEPAAKQPAPRPAAPEPEPEPLAEVFEPEPALEDSGEPNAASAMSDDDLIAALEAMDSGGSGGDDEVPEDRAELYKLLDD